MPNVSVASLKRENDSFKGEIAALKRNLEELQQSIKRQDPQASNNGGEQPTRLITDVETLSTLSFYGKSYDELRAESANSLKQLWSRLNLLSSRVEQIAVQSNNCRGIVSSTTLKLLAFPKVKCKNRPLKLSPCVSIFSKPLESKFQIKTLISPIVFLQELPLLLLDQLSANLQEEL